MAAMLLCKTTQDVVVPHVPQDPPRGTTQPDTSNRGRVCAEVHKRSPRNSIVAHTMYALFHFQIPGMD